MESIHRHNNRVINISETGEYLGIAISIREPRGISLGGKVGGGVGARRERKRRMASSRTCCAAIMLCIDCINCAWLNRDHAGGGRATAGLPFPICALVPMSSASAGGVGVAPRGTAQGKKT